MDFTIDPDTVAIAEAVLRFVEREVLPLQQRHHDLLGSERTLFDASGRYVPEALALRQQVRKRSAELGFYTLFGDEKLGGGGQGAQVMAHVQASVDGNFTTTLDEWKNSVRQAKIETDPIADKLGNPGVSNGNAFYLMLSALNGNWDRMSDVYASETSTEMGRKFWSLNLGKLGIRNKV